MKILIYNSGGGLGDSIQLFNLISSLSDKFGSRNIYYLSSHANHFNNALKDYNIYLNELKINVLYFGFRWWHLIVSKKKILKDNSIDYFDLIIDLQSKLRNTLILKQFPHKNFYSPTFNFRFCNIKKNYISVKYQNINILTNIKKLLDIEIPLKEYDLNSIDKKFFDEAKKLLPSENYIGFSLTQGNKYRKKSWALEKFINLAKKISARNKKIVFFIDKNETEIIAKIKNEVNCAIFPESMSSLSGPPLVSVLSKRLEKAISIDNGIMHMMGLANIPMIVLFGPTNSKKFAPKIKNIAILDSKIIYNSNDIQKITDDDILKLL